MAVKLTHNILPGATHCPSERDCFKGTSLVVTQLCVIGTFLCCSETTLNINRCGKDPMN